MSVKLKGSGAPAPLLKNASAAPVVYFDGVPVFGNYLGNIEIELATRVLMPKADGQSVGADMLCVAHLRASPAAIAALGDACGKALDMLAKRAAEAAAAAETK